MTPTKWFDRTFDFSFSENILPFVIERLWGTSIRLQEKLKVIPVDIQLINPNNKWSIREHIGHLTDLEILWQTRLQDILEGKEVMTAWDVTNAKTAQANHNAKSADALIAEFNAVRHQTLAQLDLLKEEDVFKFALHPRLQTPMRVVDLFLFVTEHDDHHLVNITNIYKQLIK